MKKETISSAVTIQYIGYILINRFFKKWTILFFPALEVYKIIKPLKTKKRLHRKSQPQKYCLRIDSLIFLAVFPSHEITLQK